jgi:hypothetical protein
MRLSTAVAALSVTTVLVAVSACGRSSPARHNSSLLAKSPAEPGARSIERALLAHGGPPRPTTANCRASSSAERTSEPFGRTRLPLFKCDLTVTGERASYVVQVLENGCFVAERRRLGRAVYGCGAAPFRYK